LGCLPLWLNNFEYSGIIRDVRENGLDISAVLAKPDFSDFVDVASSLISKVKNDQKEVAGWIDTLRDVVRKRCSYESTTPVALTQMKLV
jgi:hypothetical protein